MYNTADITLSFERSFMKLENNTKKQYTKYTRHVNDSGERIEDQHINVIQKDLQDYQTQLNSIKDNAFMERVSTIFNNNYYANAMFVDLFENEMYINSEQSTGYTFLKQEGILKAKEDSAVVYSTKIVSRYGANVGLNDFFIITNEKIPVGASIKYYLITTDGDKWQISSQDIRRPLHLKNDIIDGVELRIEMTKNAAGESPELNGYALLHFDRQVEENLGITNPDLRRFP